MHKQSPLRIALLTHSVNARGGVVHTLELAHTLQKLGHEVTIMATAMPQQKLFRATSCALEMIAVPGKPGSTREMVGDRIKAYVEHLAARNLDEHFDILHTQDGIGANALATIQERGLISGFIRTVHHVDVFDDPLVAEWQDRSLHTPSKLLCVSHLWQDALLRDYGLRSSLVNNGVDLQRFTPTKQQNDVAVASRYGLKNNLLSGAPIIVSIGGVEERKNTVRLLEAFVILRHQHPDAQLVVVGGASVLDHSRYVNEFQQILQANGLTTGIGEAVVLTGTVLDVELPALLRLANAVAFPSVCEGFGLVVLEALACGTPVVVSRIAPFTEYLTDNDVLWTDPYNTDSIAASLHAAIGTSKFVPPAVCERFSWNASAQQHVAVYREFLANHARATDELVSV
jgi:glycosyltransferase-like protein